MKLLIFLLFLPLIAAKYEGCSHAVPSSVQLALALDRFTFFGNLHELRPIQNLIDTFIKPQFNLHVFLSCYDEPQLKKKLHDSGHLTNVNYTIRYDYIPVISSTAVWDFFHQNKHPGEKTAQIFIVMIDTVSISGLEEAMWEMKKAGVEIFIVHYKHHNPELETLASFPPQRHVYSWLKHDDPDTVLSEVSQSVCYSIEQRHQTTKKELLSQVRLVNGGERCKGRVELLYNHTWSWLSDQSWNRKIADVICRQLQCGPSLEAIKGDPFGPGSGHVLEKVVCSGDERDISQCLLGVWGEEDPVKHHQSAGVVCLPSGVGSVSLVNGSGHCNGIVEVSLNNQPGRVCAWNFDMEEAAVICRHLGCGPLLQIQVYQKEANSNVTTVEKMFCSGVETKISECGISLWSPKACLFNIHAGIVCSTEGFSKMSLSSGSGICSGKVKVEYNGTLSPVCAEDWSTLEDVVLCRQVGCGPAIEMKEDRRIVNSPKTTVNVRRLLCSGKEPSLSHCGAIASNGYRCYISEADVLCSESEISKVKLVNGNNLCSGRVEVYYKQKWGTVCDEEWDIDDANVVCRQVGCGPALSVPKGAFFGPGSGPVWLEKVFCNGSESLLSQCGSLTSRRGRCIHTQDASVICKKESFSPRDIQDKGISTTPTPQENSFYPNTPGKQLLPQHPRKTASTPTPQENSFYPNTPGKQLLPQDPRKISSTPTPQENSFYPNTPGKQLLPQDPRKISSTPTPQENSFYPNTPGKQLLPQHPRKTASTPTPQENSFYPKIPGKQLLPQHPRKTASTPTPQENIFYPNTPGKQLLPQHPKKTSSTPTPQENIFYPNTPGKQLLPQHPKKTSSTPTPQENIFYPNTPGKQLLPQHPRKKSSTPTPQENVFYPNTPGKHLLPQHLRKTASTPTPKENIFYPNTPGNHILPQHPSKTSSTPTPQENIFYPNTPGKHLLPQHHRKTASSTTPQKKQLLPQHPRKTSSTPRRQENVFYPKTPGKHLPQDPRKMSSTLTPLENVFYPKTPGKYLLPQHPRKTSSTPKHQENIFYPNTPEKHLLPQNTRKISSTSTPQENDLQQTGGQLSVAEHPTQPQSIQPSRRASNPAAEHPTQPQSIQPSRRASPPAAQHPSQLHSILLSRRASSPAAQHPPQPQSIQPSRRASNPAAENPPQLHSILLSRRASFPAAEHPSQLQSILPSRRASFPAAEHQAEGLKPLPLHWMECDPSAWRSQQPSSDPALTLYGVAPSASDMCAPASPYNVRVGGL
ncbi:uncharacterized protein RCH25_044175 [Pelodytes ibericus]